MDYARGGIASLDAREVSRRLCIDQNRDLFNLGPMELGDTMNGYRLTFVKDSKRKEVEILAKGAYQTYQNEVRRQKADGWSFHHIEPCKIPSVDSVTLNNQFGVE
jgi:hypothetical protein